RDRAPAGRDRTAARVARAGAAGSRGRAPPPGLKRFPPDRLRTARGVVRSLRIYYGNRERRAAMERLYRRFINPRDLVFDLGAHGGDGVGGSGGLGGRVVAVEPQPALRTTLKLLRWWDCAVAIEPVAVGRAEGTVELKLNLDNPTVSTASLDFI